MDMSWFVIGSVAIPPIVAALIQVAKVQFKMESKWAPVLNIVLVCLFFALMQLTNEGFVDPNGVQVGLNLLVMVLQGFGWYEGVKTLGRAAGR